jgi:hypothetical protein
MLKDVDITEAKEKLIKTIKEEMHLWMEY